MMLSRKTSSILIEGRPGRSPRRCPLPSFKKSSYDSCLRALLILLFCLPVADQLHAQPNAPHKYTISTIAGKAPTPPLDGIAGEASFGKPEGIAVDSLGNIYVSDQGAVRKVNPAGLVTTLAGPHGFGYPNPDFLSSPEIGKSPMFNDQGGLAIDSADNLYVADAIANIIVKISPAGIVTKVAGTPGKKGRSDGLVETAEFNSPNAVAVDGQGNLYISDAGNYTIRKIAVSGAVTTLAGMPGERGTADGIGSTARFNYIYGVAVDSAGVVYVADHQQLSIRKVTPTGLVSTLFCGLEGGGRVAPASSGDRVFPNGVAVDRLGNVFIIGSGNMIRKISLSGVVSNLAGTKNRGHVDGAGQEARFAAPNALTVDRAGNVFVADTDNQAVRKVTPEGLVSTLAGRANSGSAPVTSAVSPSEFRAPSGLALDHTGNVYVADSGSETIKKITPAGIVSVVAGQVGSAGYRDGAVASALFDGPCAIAADTDDNLFVADSRNKVIRKITPAGLVTTLLISLYEDGAVAPTARPTFLKHPVGVAVDRTGNLFVTDSFTNSIVKVTPSGLATTLVSNPNLSSDGLLGPSGAAIDSSGNIYVTDTRHFVIRKVGPTGVMTTLAGRENVGGCVDGAGDAARFYDPIGIAIDKEGNLFVADVLAVRRVTPAGVVTTLAGEPNAMGSEDGKGADARFRGVCGLVVDSSGTFKDELEYFLP